jgi:hypothetical protein
VIGVNVIKVNKSYLRKSQFKVYPISHPAVRANGARDERGGISG